MNLNWIETAIYGLVMGITEVLPVSSRAHGAMLSKLLGQADSPLITLLLHLAAFLAIYTGCQAAIVRMLRALALSRVPKRRRKRPLDTKSLMDFRLWRTTVIPVVLCFFFYDKVRTLDSNLLIVSAFVMFNGLLLYIPQFFPGCNKDARNLSRFQGLAIGFAMGLSVFPGISGLGAALAIGLILGVESHYAVNLCLLTNLAALVCLIVHDVLAIAAVGIGMLTAVAAVKLLFMALAAFGGCRLAIRIMRKTVTSGGVSAFAYYCWGVALLVFILNLLA